MQEEEAAGRPYTGLLPDMGYTDEEVLAEHGIAYDGSHTHRELAEWHRKPLLERELGRRAREEEVARIAAMTPEQRGELKQQQDAALLRMGFNLLAGAVNQAEDDYFRGWHNHIQAHQWYAGDPVWEPYQSSGPLIPTIPPGVFGPSEGP